MPLINIWEVANFQTKILLTNNINIFWKRFFWRATHLTHAGSNPHDNLFRSTQRR